MADEKNIQADHGKTLASWEFPEYVKYKKTKRWFIIASLIIGAVIIYSIFAKNFIFILLIVLLIFIYALRSRVKPRILKLDLTEDGIEIGGDTFYEWKDIKKFWIIYEPPEVKNLYFNFKTGIRPGITISIENEDPVKIREILLQYLKEDLEKENESFSDGVTRIMKL